MYFKRTYEDKMDPDYAIIPSWGAYSDYRAAFTDPFVNATVGASYLSECLQAASNIYGGPLKAEALSRAAACYNGGIDEADKPEEKRQELIAQYREAFSNPYVAAEHRLVDAVIEPALTRRHVAQALEYLRIKRQPRPHKKHGLMPL